MDCNLCNFLHPLDEEVDSSAWWEATKSEACTQLCDTVTWYRSIFSVHGRQHMFVHSLDNAPSTSSWVMHYVVFELIMEEKASIQIICVSLEATTAALRKH